MNAMRRFSIPQTYAMSDYPSTFATVPLVELIGAMKRS